MTKKIFFSTITVVISVLLLCVALITGVLYTHFEKMRIEQMEMTASYLVQGVENEGISYFDNIRENDCRVTWISADGTVIYDSRTDAANMENHKDREEVREALENTSGISVRESTTFSEKTIYYAVRLNDGSVLRLSMAHSSVFFLLGGMLSPILFILLVAMIFSAILSYRVSRNIVRPLSEIDLTNPDQVETYDELSPFLQRIAAQKRQIDANMAEIRKQQHKFTQITENMSEGLFFVDNNYQILSYNKSAMQIFNINVNDEHQNLLSINRSESFRNAVDDALHGKHSQEILRLDGRIYQIIANAVQQENSQELVGAVIFILDVTEREEQEQYRREFTANVSHELKTPLTSISGIAEIIRNGIVKPEDIPHFAGKIYDESQRLVTLIGDIIKLSQLDENQIPLERETVDVLDIAKDVSQQLQAISQKNSVIVSVKGSHAIVMGVRQVLYEMVYNLCENAVKYNRKNGRVWLTVDQLEDDVIFSVKDTGIGIPVEDQSRVFERFYRVDKSHSKAVGGTGLGLSIVKHGAALHHAKIFLQSEVGTGTQVTLIFPRYAENTGKSNIETEGDIAAISI